MDEFVIDDYHGANDRPPVVKEYWTIGNMLDPQPEDQLRYFDDDLMALNHAEHVSECRRNEIIAVWDRRDDVCWIFINGQQFAPV